MVIQSLGKTTLEMRDHYKDGDSIARLRRPARPAAACRARSGTWCWSAADSAWRRCSRSCARSRRRATAPPGSSASATRTWSSGKSSSRRCCDDLIVCTDDGSYGKPGFVTAALQEVLRERPTRPGRRHRPAADDERLRRDHAAVRRQDHGVAQRHHGRRHRHVRLLPRHGRQRDQVRLRRRPRLRRPPGRLQGAACCARSASRARRPRPAATTRMSATSRSCCSSKASATTRSTRTWRRRRRKMPERDPLERVAQLQGGQPRLLDGRRAGRGRALHPVQQGRLHRRLPGVDRHPALHPSPAGARRRRRARPSSTSPTCSRRSAAASARRSRSARRSASSAASSSPVAIGRLERFVGDNARPPKAAAPRFERSARQGGDRRLRPVRPRGRRRPGALRLRRSPSTRRCTWSAACCSTASPRSACRARSSAARSRR